MPLRDHFHPPLKSRRHWEGFHSAWANTIVRNLARKVYSARRAVNHEAGQALADLFSLDRHGTTSYAVGFVIVDESPRQLPLETKGP